MWSSDETDGVNFLSPLHLVTARVVCPWLVPAPQPFSVLVIICLLPYLVSCIRFNLSKDWCYYLPSRDL
jgi:hypothetical protein